MESKIDWSAINAEWESSKLSQEAFCQSKEIIYSTFVYHRGKILEKRKAAKRPPFASVRIKDTESFSVCDTLTLRLPNGISLSIAANVNHSDLKQVLILLGVGSC